MNIVISLLVTRHETLNFEPLDISGRACRYSTWDTVPEPSESRVLHFLGIMLKSFYRTTVSTMERPDIA